MGFTSSCFINKSSHYQEEICNQLGDVTGVKAKLLPWHFMAALVDTSFVSIALLFSTALDLFCLL